MENQGDLIEKPYISLLNALEAFDIAQITDSLKEIRLLSTKPELQVFSSIRNRLFKLQS